MLRTVLDAVLASTSDQCGKSADAHDAMVRNHVTSLLSALLPIAQGHGTGAADALKLIEHAYEYHIPASHKLPNPTSVQMGAAIGAKMFPRSAVGELPETRQRRVRASFGFYLDSTP